MELPPIIINWHASDCHNNVHERLMGCFMWQTLTNNNSVVDRLSYGHGQSRWLVILNILNTAPYQQRLISIVYEMNTLHSHIVSWSIFWSFMNVQKTTSNREVIVLVATAKMVGKFLFKWIMVNNCIAEEIKTGREVWISAPFSIYLMLD